MNWRQRTRCVLARALLATLAAVGACVPKPAPVTPGAPSSPKPSARNPQLGPLYFDPEGADFTLWVQHFKNEVYRNWIVPQEALVSATGHVDLEFTVETNGSMSGLRMLRSSGSPELDEAAQRAFSSSHFLALPPGYRVARVTMQVTFYYGEPPR